MKLQAFVSKASLLTILLLALGACGGGQAEGDGKLTILEWSGYEATENPDFFGPFVEKYGENFGDKLDYIFFAEDAEAYAKIQTDVAADLVHPCNSWWQLYVDNGLVQEIDTSKLSNWSHVNPALAALGQFDGKQYFVPWDWGYESMLVRTDLVPEVPTSWADLWNPQYAGHIALWDSGEANYAMTALAFGIDPWNSTPENDEFIKQKLIELKPNVLTYWSDYTEAYDLPQTGDAWIVVNAWQDAYANADSNGFAVEYVQPSEGRLGWVCGFGISTNTADLDLAYEYIDASIADSSMAALANTYWYGPANTNALADIDPYVVEFMELDQANSIQERTSFYQPITEEQRQTRTGIWDEVKVSQ
ncbi:MAG: ABC transporter substrate-binding protein [Anaerolineales bacterium]|nr:ABC transporter substrate-binding protein [Anaerolineales bacterium]